MPGDPSAKKPAQALMETRLMAHLYESILWRRNPLLGLLLGTNSNGEYRLIVRSLNLRGDENILDLACGPGIYTRRFAHGARRGTVTGMDLSWPMLAHGWRLVQRGRLVNIRLLQGDALALPFQDAQFDVVNCAAALHLFGDLARAFSEVHRVLKPGGRFTFSTFRYPRDAFVQGILWMRRNIAGIRSFRQEEIENELTKAGFGNVRYLHARRIWMVVLAIKAPV
jgi:SAM-dependent methyltransferase